jgi:hypothetical protein
VSTAKAASRGGKVKLSGIQIRGYRWKDGKLVPDEKRFSVSKQLQRRAGGRKRVRVVKRGTAT